MVAVKSQGFLDDLVQVQLLLGGDFPQQLVRFAAQLDVELVNTVRMVFGLGDPGA